eukprot:TRINITY_DN9230_c0_g1_i1.p1 TRINITY_DN9230_c0_g1~~TRINITY_DN9230_c0_g1_i1.p1  ORF type:complete len:989 (-),score=90.98 TRINITY_DN9230_c0_g1_i1:311-3106(-)
MHSRSREWFVTASNRVKMIHRSTSRPDGLMAPSTNVQNVVALKLSTKAVDSKGCFEVQVARDKRDNLGFEVMEGPLRVTSVSTDMKEQTPLIDNDIIVAVEGVRVTTLAEYVSAVRGLREFRMTLKAREVDNSKAIESTRTAIEFDVVEVAAREDTGFLRVPLRRIGDLSGRLEWEWYVENGDVVESIFRQLKRAAGSGIVVFEEGKSIAYIEVKVPRDPTWNVESVYFVHLRSQPKTPNVSGVILGDVKTLYVYSVNLSSFPARAYGDLNKPRLEPSVRRLNRCFWEHNYTEIPSETKWGIFYSLIPPVLNYITQVQQTVLVDCGLVVLNRDAESDSKCIILGSVDISSATRMLNALTIVAISKLSILAISHLVSVRKRMLRLGGKATIKLRANAFATMLQLSEQAKDNFDDGDIQKALDTEVGLAIQCVWLRMFDLVEDLLDLALNTILTFQVVFSIQSDSSPRIILCIPFMIASLAFVFFCRGRTQFDLRHDAALADENWSAFVAMCSACNPLILAYKRGWHFTKSFQECHSEYNNRNYDASVYSQDTLWILRYIYLMVSTLVVVSAGIEVQQDKLTVGSFLVLIVAVEGFGRDLNALAIIVNNMVSGSAAVGKIASVLNSETRRMERCKHWSAATSEQKLSDGLTINLEGVSFAYASNSSIQAVPPLSISIQAGELVCIPHRSTSGVSLGTNTLFKLIAGALLPTEGHVVLPNRWRIVYMPVLPIIFDGTLMYNLTFGEKGKLHSRKTIFEICRALGMSSYLLNNEDFDVGSHGCCLKFSDRVIISITRALLHDVDLLLISSALDVLGERHASKLLRYLSQYTKQRGLEDDHLPMHLRHMKTVLYTTKFVMLQKQASEIVVFPEVSRATAKPVAADDAAILHLSSSKSVPSKTKGNFVAADDAAILNLSRSKSIPSKARGDFPSLLE